MSKVSKRRAKGKAASDPTYGPELQVELLRERIYATIALLAVLLTIDPSHTSPAKAAILIGGTALSLWAASMIASRLSYRVIMQRTQSEEEISHDHLRHAPLLAAAFLPMVCVGLSYIHVLSLEMAINISIGLLFLLLFSWSLLSAKPIKTDVLTTLVIAGVELGIGVAVIFLKKAVGH